MKTAIGYLLAVALALVGLSSHYDLTGRVEMAKYDQQMKDFSPFLDLLTVYRKRYESIREQRDVALEVAIHNKSQAESLAKSTTILLKACNSETYRSCVGVVKAAKSAPACMSVLREAAR